MRILKTLSNDLLSDEVAGLPVVTCLFLWFQDRQSYSGSRSWLSRLGVPDPSASEIRRFVALVRKKALLGTVVAAFVGIGLIWLYHYLGLPPFR